jgi:hypothetical protein
MGAKQKESELDLAAIGNDPARERGTLRHIGGSPSDDWNARIAHETMQALGMETGATPRDAQAHATVNGLIGIAPQDEVEAMMAAQLIAVHGASMESLRQARGCENNIHAQAHYLGAANRLTRGFAVVLAALHRHRSLMAQKAAQESPKG